jgi:hypothetical protein
MICRRVLNFARVGFDGVHGVLGMGVGTKKRRVS